MTLADEIVLAVQRCQRCDNGRMVTGLFVFAWCTINDASGSSCLECRAEQDMVNAQASVFLEPQHAIVPPGKALVLLIEKAERI